MANGFALFLVLSLGADPSGQSLGFSYSENFKVFAPSQELSDEVLAEAERLRKKLSGDLFNKRLPDGAGPSVIHIRFSSEDTAFTSRKTTPEKHFHHVTIRATRESAFNGMLGHELTHALIATEFGDRAGRFLDEGLATLQDDADRQGQHRRYLLRWIESGEWPNLRPMLNQVGLSSNEPAFYAAANSFAEFLLEADSPATLFQFAICGNEKSWDAAAKLQYDCPSLAELEGRWHAWAKSRFPSRRPQTAVKGVNVTPINQRLRPQPTGRVAGLYRLGIRDGRCLDGTRGASRGHGDKPAP